MCESLSLLSTEKKKRETDYLRYPVKSFKRHVLYLDDFMKYAPWFWPFKRLGEVGGGGVRKCHPMTNGNNNLPYRSCKLIHFQSLKGAGVECRYLLLPLLVLQAARTIPQEQCHRLLLCSTESPSWFLLFGAQQHYRTSKRLPFPVSSNGRMNDLKELITKMNSQFHSLFWRMVVKKKCAPCPELYQMSWHQNPGWGHPI